MIQQSNYLLVATLIACVTANLAGAQVTYEHDQLLGTVGPYAVLSTKAGCDVTSVVSLEPLPGGRWRIEHPIVTEVTGTTTPAPRIVTAASAGMQEHLALAFLILEEFDLRHVVSPTYVTEFETKVGDIVLRHRVITPRGKGERRAHWAKRHKSDVYGLLGEFAPDVVGGRKP